MSNSDKDSAAFQNNQDVFMDALYWYGVPTLFRAPHYPDPSQCDIALVGVPHSTGNAPQSATSISVPGRFGIFPPMADEYI